MKKIVVNDTNVFIDLFNVGLLEGFFLLTMGSAYDRVCDVGANQRGAA